MVFEPRASISRYNFALSAFSTSSVTIAALFSPCTVLALIAVPFTAPLESAKGDQLGTAVNFGL